MKKKARYSEDGLFIIELFANVKCFDFYIKPSSGQFMLYFLNYSILKQNKKKWELLAFLFH